MSGSAKHLSVEDLAERMGVPVNTVYDWNARGMAPKRIKIGKYVRYRETDVAAWEKSHETT